MAMGVIYMREKNKAKLIRGSILKETASPHQLHLTYIDRLQIIIKCLNCVMTL